MKRKLSSWLKRWHRRLGIVSAIFVIILTVTGLLLLFSVPLGLDQKSWSGPLVSSIYHRAPKTTPVGIALGGEAWVIMVDGLVYIGAADPIALEPPLMKAQRDGRFVTFANANETIVTLHDGTLVERLSGVNFTGVSPTPLPAKIRNDILRRYAGRGMPVSRILLDIHTGRFFGAIGPWLMALASMFLLGLSLSGLYLWFRKPNGKKSRT